MAEKIKGWKNTSKRFVAFLDIMGFKDMVYKKSHKEVKNTLLSFYPAIKTIEEISAKYMGKIFFLDILNDAPDSNPSVVLPVLFSDSILLISNNNSDRSAYSILTSTSHILHQAISKRIPIKGAIAYGELTADLDKSLYFGKPLIYAYELQKELQLYGVVLHHTMENLLTEFKPGFFKVNEKINERLFKYPVPLKSGRISHYILDWLYMFDLLQSSDERVDPVNVVSNMYNDVSGKSRIYIDNTIEFLNWLKKKKAEIAKQKPV